MKVSVTYDTPTITRPPESLMTEEEIRQRMSDITRRNNDERQKLREAYEALGCEEAKATLAITFNKPELLHREEARAMLKEAIENGVKLTDMAKKALAEYDVEPLQISYDLAKFDCDTTDKDYAKLEKQLSFIQSEMKLV